MTAYSDGNLTINVTRTGGSGTFASWDVDLAGDPGSGDLLSSSKLSELTNKAAALNTLNGVSYGTSQTLTAAQKNQAQKNSGLASVLRGYIDGLTLPTAGASATLILGITSISSSALIRRSLTC